VRRALAGLPPEQRQVLELAYFHGLTHREIALLLELPAGTVKGRTRLGLQKLREELAPGEELDLNPPQAMRASSPR
jgi:RNA polymerase sigma-70 factor (ECF subfamily)